MGPGIGIPSYIIIFKQCFDEFDITSVSNNKTT